MRVFNETNPISSADFVGVVARNANWPGDEVNLFRAVPFAKTRFGPIDYLSSLENLGVKPVIRKTEQRDIREDDLPCIFLSHGAKPRLIIEQTPEALNAIEAETGRKVALRRDREMGTVLKAVNDPDFARQNAAETIFDALTGLGDTVAPLIFTSLLINLLTLAGPLLVMTVYDTVIPSNTTDLVWSFALLVVTFLTVDFILRAMRAEVLARIGAAAERRMSLALFTKLLALPLAQVSRSTTHQQVNRIRQFESARDVFSGNLLVNLLDFPFIFVFLAVIFAIAPPVGFLLLGSIVLFVFVSLFSYSRIAGASAASAKAQYDHAALVHEISEHGRTLAHVGLSDAYAARCDTLSASLTEASRVSKTTQSLFANLTQTVVAIGVLASIALAALLAMEEMISFGALIAVATLAGRVLGPVQLLCTNVLKIRSVISSARQINTTLGLPTELQRGHSQSRLKTFEGAISAKGVFVKFEAASEPSLSGISFEIAPRSLVVLCGRSAAGKSTLLKALVKLHTPASGSLSLQGINIKQITVDDLRHTISLNTHETSLFNFSLRENLMLGNPMATDAMILELYRALGAEKDLRRFHRGLDTDLSRVAQTNMSANVLGTMSIVRCLAKPSSVYLLDDPFVGMTSPRVDAIWSYITKLSVEATVIVVSDRLQHLIEADQVLMLDKGRLLVNGPGVEVGQKAHAMLKRTKDT